MKKHVLFITLFLILAAGFAMAEKVTILKEVMKPTQVVVDDKQLYAIEGTTIHIYSLKDFKYINKFGRAGEGPQEFLRFATVQAHKDILLVNSMGKLSFYTRDGKFQKELKAPPGIFNGLFLPLKDGYAGMGVAVEENIAYRTVNLYDAQLQKQKEIFKIKSGAQQTGKIELLKGELAYQTYEDKLYVSGKDDFIIDVMDHTGKALFTIKQEVEKIKLSDDFIKKLDEVLKLQLKGQYDVLKSRIQYPDYFPAIINFIVNDGIIFVITWKQDGGKYDILLFDAAGKFLKKTVAPFFMQDALRPHPANFGNGNMYQLNENADEEWELHITKLL